MGVCKFFMEGYCKFGARCKFDHVEPYRGYDSPGGSDYSSDRPQGTSILKAASSSFGTQEFVHPPQGFVQQQQHGYNQYSFNRTPQNSFSQSPHGFGTPTQQNSFAQKPSGLKYNVQDIMQIVLRDITQLEKGGQWQLSCYSPLKELPNMPGLEDYSPEELRWECYKALQNRSLPLCQVIVQQLYGNVAKMNNDLKRKDSAYSIIDRWLREVEQRAAQNTTPAQPTPSAFASPLHGNVTTSAFSSPFFTSNEPQTQQPPPHPLQQQPQPAVGAFSFSLSPQQQQQPPPPPPNAQMFQQNSPVFSSNQSSAFTNQSASPFLSQPRAALVDSQAYSTNEALSESELRAFQADRFTLGSIPTKPPPRALCNL